MADKKEKPKQYLTPRVTFIYPRLNKPDDKFKPLNPEFSVRFLADPDVPVIAELVEQLDKQSAEQEQELRKQIAANKNLTPPKRKEALESIKVMKGYEEDYDDNDQPTGLLKFKASTGSVFKQKDGKKITRKVPIFDAKRNDITKRAPPIGHGSEGKLIVTVGSGISAGNAYAKLYLNSVQLLRLVEPGQGGGGLFQNEEDGFDADDYGAQDDADTEAAGASGDDGDDEL